MRGWSHVTSRRYSPELRERAVRMVLEHQHEYASQWAAIVSIAEKFGPTPETLLRRWVRQAGLMMVTGRGWAGGAGADQRSEP